MRLFRRDPVPAESGTVILGGAEIPFTLIRNRRRRRTISYTIEPDVGLRILAPVRTDSGFIASMLRKRSGSILRRIEKLRHIERVLPLRFTDGENVRYLGHDYRLRVTKDDIVPQGCRIGPRRFEVSIADNALSKESLREEVRLEILLWMKKRAKAKLQKRMEIWAEKLGVSYRKLVLSDPERQWGSCNAQNVIRLNWRLIMAPLPLIDYVAAHELCHVRHKNHGPRFWYMLERSMPDYKDRRKQLRRMGPGLVL